MLPSITFGTRAEFDDLVPGVYRNIPERAYHDVPIHVASKSRLWTLDEKNPRRVVHGYENRDQPKTPATKLGNAAHAYILEPDEYDRNYGVFRGDLRTNAAKARYAEMVLQYGENYVIRTNDLVTCEAMREACMDHADARDYLEQDGERELTILWIHEETGLLVKSRIDIYPFRDRLVVDLKTAKEAHRSGFKKAIGSYGYDEQAACYMKACQSVGLEARGTVFIAVEKEPPYDVYSWQLAGAAITDGWTNLQHKFAAYAECVNSGKWPGPPGRTQLIDVPHWRTQQIHNPSNHRA